MVPFEYTFRGASKAFHADGGEGGTGFIPRCVTLTMPSASPENKAIPNNRALTFSVPFLWDLPVDKPGMQGPASLIHGKDWNDA